MKPLIRALVFIAFCATIFFGAAEGWVSYILCWTMISLLSVIVLRKLFRNDQSEVTYLFLFALCVYSIYMYVTNWIYVKNPRIEFFMIVDSMKFWSYSDYPMYGWGDVWETFKKMAPFTTRYPLFHFITLVISFISQLIDANNILIQKFQSVWLGAFSIPFIYMIFRKYFNKQKSYKYALFFAFFSFTCIYSIVFNRDPYVYFLYTIGFYLLVYYDTQKHVILKLGAILVLLIGFRIEHALFFTTFLLGYFYLKAQKNKSLLLMFIVLIPVVIIVLSPVILDRYEDNVDNYQAQLDRVSRETKSAGASFSRLPPGIKQVFRAANSQIAPAVPFWRGWYQGAANQVSDKYKQPGYYTPWRFMESVAAIVWIYVWGIVFTGFRRKYYKETPLAVKLAFGIAVLLLLMATTVSDVRRLYCVYPAIFLIAVLFFNRMDRKMFRVCIRNTSFVLAGLYVVFLIFKGV